jgi:ferredoxin-NADP reductase
VNDPHIWWYITRATAIVAWCLMTFSVLWGILLSTRVLRKIDSPSWLQDIHGFASGASVVMVLLHLISLMLDGWLHFSVPELLVPFAAHYRALPVTIGVFALYVLIAVQATSLLLRRLPRRFWRIVHYSSYALLVLVAFHSGLTGTDVGSLWYRELSFSLIALTSLVVVVRVIAGRRSAGVSRGLSTASPESAPTREAAMVRRTLVVTRSAAIADGVLGLRLSAEDGSSLPLWEPGAHLTLHLENGLDRQYSLCGDPADRSRYEISVLRTQDSAGGSAWVHEQLGAGRPVTVSGPQNHFELEPATHYLFIAGGIGITPIMAMIESLPARRDWTLLYFGRDRRAMAFVDELEREHPGRVVVRASNDGAPPTRLADYLSRGMPLVYCCGPASLMDAVAELVPRDRLRSERFVPLQRRADIPQEISVSCRRSRISFTVAPDASVLSAMESNGVPILGSCRTGVCGTCEVRVVTGTPEHLDSVLDDDAKDALGIMYPCVSRSRTAELVLDA